MRALRSIALLTAAAAAVVCPRSAEAQSPGWCDRQTGQVPTVLTVEGGGSLGVYEAGVTYTLVEVFKRIRGAPDSASPLPGFPHYCLYTATGASAGNINSFLAAIAWCDTNVTARPEESSFWETWITTGLTQLYPGGDDESARREGGLFSRRHFSANLEPALRRNWKKVGWLDGCHVDFGATVTRLTADTVPGAGSIKARNQRMAYAFRIKGVNADGTPKMIIFRPRSTPYQFGKLAALPSVRGVDSAYYIPWNEAFRLIQTSSGFPVAFQPLTIPYCTRFVAPQRDSSFARACEDTATVVALDGGVFDNGPIGLGYSLYFEAETLAVAPTAIYLSPDRRRVWIGQTRDIVQGTRRSKPKPDPYGLESITQLAQEALPTARQYELQFAGRLLPAEMLKRAMTTEVQGLRHAVDTLSKTMDAERARHAAIAGSLLLSLSRVCGELRTRDSVLADTTRQLPRSCSSIADADTTRLRESVVQQGIPLERRIDVTVPATSMDLVRAIESLDATFRSTERWHPLAGDWIGGFGAFLARPLREYDFYVGIYDAFVLLAENIACNRERLAYADSVTPASDRAYRACLADTVGAYLRRPPIPLGPVAWAIARDLYVDEFGKRPPGDTPPRTVAEDSALQVARAVHHAMNQARMVVLAKETGGTFSMVRRSLKPGHCENIGVFERTFCENGLVAFLDELSQERLALDIMKRWSADPACAESRWRQATDCRAERRFVAMIEDPEGQLFWMTDQLLARLESVTPDSAGSRTIASGLLFLHSFADRHRRGFDLGPTSMPSNAGRIARTLYSFAPSSFGLTPNTAGYGELGWELRRHVGATRYAISLPVHYRPRSQLARDSSGTDRDLLVAGIRFEHKAFLPMNTRVGLEYDRWMLPRRGLARGNVGYTKGVFISVAGKGNLSITGVPRDLPVYRSEARMRPLGRPTVWTVGVGDVNGLSYWLFRRILF